MSNFKIGEKVVCINSFYSKILNCEDLENNPKINEIVTICGLYENGEYLYISEYPFNEIGNKQVFDSSKFRKIDHQFAEDVCAELIANFKEVEANNQAMLNAYNRIEER
jgi:hypothetical protein